MNTAVVILAAGKGTRMQSDLPKVLHPIRNRPMIQYLVDTAWTLTGSPPFLVVGYGAEQVRAAVGDRARYVLQTEQKGTGHALRQAEPVLRGRYELVLVANGDLPLLTPGALRRLLDAHIESPIALSMLTVIAENPRGFGRVVRGPAGRVSAIVEEAQATPEQLEIRELNVGAYAFAGRWVWEALAQIGLSPKGEYYLTDLVDIALRQGRMVEAIPVDDPVEAMGINAPEHLSEVEAALAARTHTRG